MAQLQFDATQYNPEQGIGHLPIGRHLVIIEADEIKKAKESQGGYLQLNLKCVQGDAQGQGHAYRLNLYNNNPQTVDIAHRQLSAVCYAVGVLGINGDTSVIHNLPFQVDVVAGRSDEAKEKGWTEVAKVYTANGEEIKAGMQPGGSKGGQQGDFGAQNNQGNQNQNNFGNNQNNGGFNNGNNQGGGQDQQQQFNQNTSNQGQPQFGQGNQNNNNGGGQPQFGQGGNQNNNGGWQPGQGNNNQGAQWQPRQN